MFTLKSQDNIAMFENPDEYMRYLCADHLEKMNDWVLSIRAVKVNSQNVCYTINLNFNL